jgi:hypothetical protein
MRRTSKVLFLVGIFLVISVLWPYDPTTDTADAVRSVARSSFSLLPMEPKTYVFMNDEWQGETSRVLFQRDVTVFQGIPQTVALPKGERILPGTEYLVFSHDVRTMDGQPSDVSLRLHGANGAGWPVVLTGEVTRIQITEEMNDWSPDPETRWTFSLSTDKGAIRVQRLKLEIVKSDSPLPDLLPYNDRWQGERRVRIFDQGGALNDARVASRQSMGYSAGPLTSTMPPDVPYLRNVPPRGVDELHIALVYNSSTPSEVHYRPTLFFRGADLTAPDWEVQGMPPTLADPRNTDGRFEWRMPIDPRMWDSPFAPQTGWTVEVNWRGESTDLPVYMSGNYHFWMEVHKGSEG